MWKERGTVPCSEGMEIVYIIYCLIIPKIDIWLFWRQLHRLNGLNSNRDLCSWKCSVKIFSAKFSCLYSSHLLYIYIPSSLLSCLCPCTLAKSPEAPIERFPWESIHPLAFQHTAGNWQDSRHRQHGHFHSKPFGKEQAISANRGTAIFQPQV